MARIGNKKAFTIHLSDEMAVMIDLKRKEWGLKSRGEVIERLLGWMIEPTDADGWSQRLRTDQAIPEDKQLPRID